ncbi:hypothetical protein [Acinetobacter colistiniresistens]|uniref:hypothetical protein n=1 Tax=Acinetobacter colistiniresistens TaxID=280145 RepID=UPI0012503523|nr:hypothetical protein [Acinetobacter colistiniresistens]
MKNINHLSPLFNFYTINSARRSGREFMIMGFCQQLVPELKFDFFDSFPFNPKHCPKVAQRRIRRACYQSFALYKKSIKPKRLPRFRFIKDELPWEKYDDHIDAMSHLFCNENFHKQYLVSWAQEPEQQVFKGLYPKQLINRLDGRVKLEVRHKPPN